MRIKLLVSAIAIAFAATMGSAFAAEKSILSGVQAEPLTAAEMEQVQGKWTVPSVAGGFLPGNSHNGHRPFDPPGRS